MISLSILDDPEFVTVAIDADKRNPVVFSWIPYY
jgi:hypothetical protein